MNDNYNDIKHLQRPQYDDLPPMPVSDRAAQFFPFAALVGYDKAVEETSRIVGKRIELTEAEVNELNSALTRLVGMLDEQPVIRVTYFVPDKRKSGGSYAEKTGIVRIFDSYTDELVFTDGARISVKDIYSVVLIDEEM